MENSLVKQVSQVLLTMQRYSWEQGVAAQAFLELGETNTAILLAREAVQRQSADGRLACMHANEAVTDPAANGEALLAAARITKDPVLQVGLDAMLNYLVQTAPRAADGTLFHVVTAKEVWVDSLYMAPPFLAVTGRVDDALRQIHGIKRRLWNPDANLYAHIWNEERSTLTRSAHWGVGNGWAAAGITRVIRALPSERTDDRQSLACMSGKLSMAVWLINARMDYSMMWLINPSLLSKPIYPKCWPIQSIAVLLEGGCPQHTQKRQIKCARQFTEKWTTLVMCRECAPLRHLIVQAQHQKVKPFFYLMEAAWKETL